MKRLFGTDGIRSRFGESPLDQTTIRRVGWALARFLSAQNDQADEPRVLVGGDTRASTPTLARWLAEGLGEAAYEAVKGAMEAKVPLGRVCDPEDVAAAILSLVAGSELVTGQVLPVEGGMLIAG